MSFNVYLLKIGAKLIRVVDLATDLNESLYRFIHKSKAITSDYQHFADNRLQVLKKPNQKNLFIPPPRP
jgi:hypothetical protein